MVDLNKVDPDLRLLYGDLTLQMEIIQSKLNEVKVTIINQINKITEEKTPSKETKKNG